MAAVQDIRAVGGHWTVSEIESAFMGAPFSAVFTLGYDPASERFVGTWIDSVSSHLRHYEGTLDADGETLTIEKSSAFYLYGEAAADAAAEAELQWQEWLGECFPADGVRPES